MPLPITAVFADLPDPRRETANKLHSPTDILVIATCALIREGGDRSCLARADCPNRPEQEVASVL